ncbi:ATP-binding protein [Janthinobacterium sp.]|uniref:ATP-binding protein n=1 Tax=Janthinobacterium sp. TaxID=1871054 RepID=UPI002624E494|nr:ATP-binding protein [Janthinobacterium sp.]
MQFEDFDFSTPGAGRHGDAASGDGAPAHTAVRLQYLLDNTPSIIYCTVPSGDFQMTFVSNNALNVLGYHPAEMLADPNFWFDHIHPDDAPGIFSSLAQVFVEGARTYEYRFRACDGGYLWMHDSLRLVRDEHGVPFEVIGSLTDITERKRMEAMLQARGEEQQLLISKLQEAHDQLLQSEKMASIGQLAAGIAHEINNPIGFVNSNMSSLQTYVGTLFDVIAQYEEAMRQPLAASALAARVQQVRGQADLAFLQADMVDLVRESMDGLKRVRDIVQALKDFSHVGETDWQIANLHAGLDSTLNIVSNELKYKARIEKHYGDLPQINCLASQLNQVFMNLLVNAGQAISGEGVISIRTGHADGWVWVEIGDTGAGIAPEHLNRIFEPFFTTKAVGSGTGLGLSLSYGIVMKHGGRIEVASVPGQGTRFTVHLPLNPPAAANARPQDLAR